MNTATPPTAKKSSKIAPSMLLASTAIFIAIAAGLGTVFLWQQYSTLDQRMQVTVNTIRHVSQKQLAQQNSNIQALQSQFAQMQEIIETTQSNLAHILKITSTSDLERALGDVAYLIHLANLHLSVGHDVSTSLHLLTLAQQRLQEMPDPSLFELKKALDHDIAQLKKTPVVNRADIALELNTLSDSIQQLPLLPTTQSLKKEIQQQQATTLSPTQKRWYQKMWENIVGLKELVVIRHVQKPVAPLVGPQQQIFLRENLQVKLIQAQWAILNQKPKLYQQSLQTAIDWLKNYYEIKSAAQPIIEKLQRLQKIDISPALPDINASLAAISKTLSSATVSPRTPSEKKIPVPQEPHPLPKEDDQKPKPLAPTPNPGVEI